MGKRKGRKGEREMKSECVKCDNCGHIFNQHEEIMKFGEKDVCQLCKPFAFVQYIIELEKEKDDHND